MGLSFVQQQVLLIEYGSYSGDSRQFKKLASHTECLRKPCQGRQLPPGQFKALVTHISQ